GIRYFHVTGVQSVLFRSVQKRRRLFRGPLRLFHGRTLLLALCLSLCHLLLGGANIGWKRPSRDQRQLRSRRSDRSTCLFYLCIRQPVLDQGELLPADHFIALFNIETANDALGLGADI